MSNEIFGNANSFSSFDVGRALQQSQLGSFKPDANKEDLSSDKKLSFEDVLNTLINDQLNENRSSDLKQEMNKLAEENSMRLDPTKLSTDGFSRDGRIGNWGPGRA